MGRSNMEVLCQIILTLMLLMFDITTHGVYSSDTALKFQQTTDFSILMTPYWDHLRFAVGESLSVDCGVYTNGQPDEFTMKWMNNKGKEILTDSRITVKRRNKISEQATEKGAYSVLTLTISNVSQNDNQTYTCQVQHGTTAPKERQITINVLAKDKWYGFEGKELSGWKNLNSTSVQWHKHNATDKVIVGRSNGLRYDHTYGPSKHIGHFIELDLEHQNATTAETIQLVSPTYQAWNTPQCLYFWYIYEAGDIDEFSVLLNDQPLSKQVISQSKRWKVRTFDIPAINKAYQIMFQTSICSQNCTSGAVALDDITIVDGPCNSSKLEWPKKNTLNVRLTGGSSDCEGRVEVLHDGQYGTVCSDHFNKQDAALICRQLGFSYNNVNSTSMESPSNTRIWLNNVDCQGTEKDISECLGQNEFFGPVCKTGAAAIKCTASPDKMCKAKILPTEPPLITEITTESFETTATTKGPEKFISTDINKTSPSNTTTIQTTTHPSSTTTKTLNINTTTTISSTATTSVTKTTTSGVTSSTKNTPTLTTTTTTTGTLSSTSATSKVPQTNTSSHADAPETDQHGVSKASKIGGGVVAGIVIIVLLGVLIFAVLVYKGRKRRMRKSKYLNFGSASYSREHLPTNEFHLESPLTMSSMGYTVLA